MVKFEGWIIWILIFIVVIVSIVIILNIFFVYRTVDDVKSDVENDGGNISSIAKELEKAIEGAESTDTKINGLSSNIKQIINTDLPSIKSDTTEIGDLIGGFEVIICTCTTGAPCCTNGKLSSQSVSKPGCTFAGIGHCFDM